MIAGSHLFWLNIFANVGFHILNRVVAKDPEHGEYIMFSFVTDDVMRCFLLMT